VEEGEALRKLEKRGWPPSGKESGIVFQIKLRGKFDNDGAEKGGRFSAEAKRFSSIRLMTGESGSKRGVADDHERKTSR